MCVRTAKTILCLFNVVKQHRAKSLSRGLTPYSLFFNIVYHLIPAGMCACRFVFSLVELRAMLVSAL